METGEVCYFKAKATILATGGAGRIYASTTNAHINTADGVGMAIRAGVPNARHRNVGSSNGYAWCFGNRRLSW
ncbi:FAD-binding protein [Vibrio lentus]|nr:FAD-binding protein [Vibrio lentus]